MTYSKNDRNLRKSEPGPRRHLTIITIKGTLWSDFTDSAPLADIGNQLITICLIHNQVGILYVDDEDILIPRISFTSVLPSGHTLLHHQFPLTLGYATTFNSCQGLNLNRVGVDLMYPVFSHGQLYTALSLIPDRTCAVIRMRPGNNSTVNVTYHEWLLQ